MAISDYSELQALLEEAKKYSEKEKCSWIDYEYFKKLFQTKGYYGYEKQIAEALNL